MVSVKGVTVVHAYCMHLLSGAALYFDTRNTMAYERWALSTGCKLVPTSGFKHKHMHVQFWLVLQGSVPEPAAI